MDEFTIKLIEGNDKLRKLYEKKLEKDLELGIQNAEVQIANIKAALAVENKADKTLPFEPF